ncbi:MAG: hypothetical protein JNJ94_09725 [Chlorobi bacterium]|nr:hypothetical protein [Chlorobiota bacterium]
MHERYITYTAQCGKLLSLMLLCTTALLAQPQGAREAIPVPLLQFGGYGGVVLGSGSGSFANLPGINNCKGDTALFDGGSGNGFAASAIVGMRPAMGSSDFSASIGWQARVGLTSVSTTFQATEVIGPAINPMGMVLPVTSKYVVETSLSELRLEPMATYQVSRTTPLVISLGARLGFLMGKTFTHHEEVAAPTGARYGDGTTERNNSSGDLQETSGFLAGLKAAVGFDFNLSPNFALRPEVGTMLGFTSPVADTDWSQTEIHAGIALIFTVDAPRSSPLGQ